MSQNKELLPGNVCNLKIKITDNIFFIISICNNNIFTLTFSNRQNVHLVIHEEYHVYFETSNFPAYKQDMKNILLKNKIL